MGSGMSSERLLSAARLLEVSSPTLPKISLYSKVLSLGGSWQLLYIKANSCAFTALGAILYGIDHREHRNERWLCVSRRCHTGFGEGGAGMMSQGKRQWPQARGPPHGARRVLASVSSGKDTPCPDRPRPAPV